MAGRPTECFGHTQEGCAVCDGARRTLQSVAREEVRHWCTQMVTRDDGHLACLWCEQTGQCTAGAPRRSRLQERQAAPGVD